MTDGLFLGKADAAAITLDPSMLNRHGLIAGATGTGKTVSLRVVVEALSAIGVPSLVADVKGDLAGLARPGGDHAKVTERAELLGLAPLSYAAAPVVFWDVYGERGHPLRATISDMGPLLLARLLGLSDIQEAVLYIAFRISDDQGLLLLDLPDLRALLAWLDENRDAVGREYGRVSSASIASIQRSLLVLEQSGADHFFGEPMLELDDLMRQDMTGRGVVNLLAAERLINNPKLYSTALLWLLSELFEGLPEVGDPDKPRLAFFFDEAHLLFDDAPKALVDKIEQVVRLIRSKGVAVFFVTQNPLDVPMEVLGQLGNRVQHALRAFTPRDQRAVQAAAETFRSDGDEDVGRIITELGVGEALVSVLDADGAPTPVRRTMIRPPVSRLGIITGDERAAAMKASPVAAKYDEPVDRESAFEMLAKRTEEKMRDAEEADNTRSKEKPGEERGLFDQIFGSTGRRQGLGEAFAKSMVRSVGSQMGRQIARGLLGSIFK